MSKNSNNDKSQPITEAARREESKESSPVQEQQSNQTPLSSSLVSNRTAIFEEKLRNEKFRSPKSARSNDAIVNLSRAFSLNTPITSTQRLLFIFLLLQLLIFHFLSFF